MNPLDIIKQQLIDRVIDLSNFICGSRVDSYEDYKRACGEIYGLKTAIDYIEELQLKMEHRFEEE